MAFHDLPPQSPLNDLANEYGRQALIDSEKAARSLPTRLDVAYGPDYWQKLDIYYPPAARPAGLPVLMFIHGGGWSHGYKEWMGFMAPAIVALPAIFVSISYRLAPEHKFPVPLDDCISAVRWVYDNADAIGASKDRLFIGGHSAGGHLSSLVALRKDAVVARGLPPDAIKGCLPVSGSYDFVYKATSSDPADQRAYDKFIRSAEDAPAASPIRYVDERSPPFILAYGSRDYDRIISQSETMVAALEKSRVPLTTFVFPDHNHFQANTVLAEPGNPWLKAAARMMGAG